MDRSEARPGRCICVGVKLGHRVDAEVRRLAAQGYVAENCAALTSTRHPRGTAGVLLASVLGSEILWHVRFQIEPHYAMYGLDELELASQSSSTYRDFSSRSLNGEARPMIHVNQRTKKTRKTRKKPDPPKKKSSPENESCDRELNI